MTNEELQGCIVMESTMEPMKPKIIRKVNEPGLFYVRFESCLQSFDCFNRNKRNYACNAMIEGFRADHIQELLRKGTFVGENGHPDSTDIKRILTVDPTKICHRILDVDVRGKLAYGTIETLNDEGYGKQFTMHILQGLHPSFSLRALAPITKLSDGRSIIKSKPHIVTYDRVILPSHREAYMDNNKPVTVIQSATESAEFANENFIYPAHDNTYDDIFFPIKESAVLEALEFVKEESTRVKELASFVNSTFGKVTLVDENTVCIEDDNQKTFVFLEDYISRDIAGCFNDINNMIK